MRRPQFSLKTMLWLIACVGCGLGGWIAGVRHNPLFVWQNRVIHEQAEALEKRRINPNIRLERLGRRYLQELEQKAGESQPPDDSPDEEVVSDGRP
ncbi:MAG TPA: hypothetical protein VG826_18040 [Pirellulales bacterium]|nr:hypothetical protein [Pirellulales bacterium]